ncbi:hypothetical protein OG339_47240 (plasmid) [Streptosporangium sp. NBC_01495]|uniref:hypothetical protein n=1 Tax=Streptosporangium sp. NBC_01495 TaxID=2903899 RepID=UPI002E2F69F4|nr:hypothetical protein [Streptosporangium sp. NBC_01495]
MARGDGGGKDGRGEPAWRPVSDVDMMTAIVLEQLGANREQVRTLEPARRSPHLLDDHTVERIKQTFGVQRDDMWLWVETGERWQAQDLTAAEAAKVDQYVAAVEAFAASNTVILALADELAAGTIEATLATSDLELGVETLAGTLARQANPFPDASPVQVRHPLTADNTDETSWPWLPGLVVGMVAPGQWDIVVIDDRLVEGLDADGVPVYPVCRRAAEAIRLR